MILFWTSLIIGLSSSLHCMGMCGPLALAIPIKRNTRLQVLGGILQYNLGRISTYALLGALIGLIGLTADTLGVLQWISIFSGIFMILFAWKKWFARVFEPKLSITGLNRFISFGMGSLLHGNSPFKLVLLGALNGLLPCGMVYLGLVNALLSGNSIGGAISMVFFGLGTLPAMIIVGFAANRISFNTKLLKLVPIILTITGVLVVLRGMNLDIPYISPKINITQQTTHDDSTPKACQQVEMSCCHKKSDSN